MNYSNFYFNLDIHSPISQISFSVKKGETSKKLNIVLTENGQPYKLAQDCAVVFSGRKEDGTIIYNDCAIKSNTIEYILTPQTTIVEGIVNCEILVYGRNSQLLYSPSFSIVVYSPTYDIDKVLPSTDEFTALTQAMGTLETLIDQAKDVIGSNADDYIIHAPNYIASNTTPSDIEIGTHVCAVTEFDSTLPESDEEYTVQGTLEVIKAFDSIDSIRMYWYPCGSHNVYSRLPITDQNWSEWETAQSGGGVGKDGLSAYEIWLQQGNTGSEADFLESLKGANGTSVTITNISESTEDNGSNIVTFSDGNNLTIRNGSQGVSGVYVGSGDMPEGYNVQIDPDGDVIDVADLSERIISLDGMITPLFESGGMAVTEGILTYATNPKKIRTKQGVLYTVKAGSKVWLTDYTGLALTIYYTYDEITFTNRSVSEGEFVFEADCSVAISINSDVAQTDLSNAEKIVFINADNVLQRVSTLEDQNGFIIDEGFGYTTDTGVIVGKTQSELNSIKTKVQSGEKYSITAFATNYYRPYATTDKNFNIIRLCETTSFSGELVIEDGEEYLVTNFKPLYENKFYLNVPETLSIIKEVHDRDFGTLVSKDIFPSATRTVTSNGITYTPDENGKLFATGSATASSYYTLFNNGFPEHFYAGETYYIDYYSFNPKIYIQIRWVDADGTYTYLHDKYFGGYFTIPKEAVGIQIRWYIGASVVGLNNYPLNARIYSAESVNFAKLRKERTQYRPMLTIIYDDSHKEFYEYILPIIQEKNVPIATAVISKLVNENDATKMTWTQIEECFLNGAEVLDHTYAHIAPATRETMGVEELEREYLMGRHLLQLKGFNPPCALIFNGYTARLENCRKAASIVYKAGFNADNKFINFHNEFDPYNINRYGTDGQTLDTLKGWIDELKAANTGWMIWMRHNSNASDENPIEAAEILSNAIDYALEHGIDIVTVERGLYEYLDI